MRTPRLKLMGLNGERRRGYRPRPTMVSSLDLREGGLDESASLIDVEFKLARGGLAPWDLPRPSSLPPPAIVYVRLREGIRYNPPYLSLGWNGFSKPLTSRFLAYYPIVTFHPLKISKPMLLSMNTLCVLLS